MSDTHDTQVARLEQIRLELTRQNETLAAIAPQIAQSPPARSGELPRSLAHLSMRRV